MPAMRPEGLFETAMALGRNLPGKAGYICYRKLKRRYRWRNQHEFDKVLADLGPGDLCIDLGGNIGEVTQAMARTGAEVITFEPDPDTFAIMAANLAGLANVTLIQKAAGVRAGTLKLRRSSRMAEDPLRYSQSASLVRDDATMDDANAVDVEVVDFPDFLRRLDRDVRILKVDIEGSEWELLEALIDDPVMTRIDAAFVETHEWMNPAVYMPLAERLQVRAEAMDRPYINLFWH
jgi:FkbM family methyltransferase